MGLAGQWCDHAPAQCNLPGELLPLGPRRELRGARGGCKLAAGVCHWWGPACEPCLRTPCRGSGHPAKTEIVQGRAAAPPCPQHSPGSGSGSNGISVPAAPVPPALAQQLSCLGWGRGQPLCCAEVGLGSFGGCNEGGRLTPASGLYVVPPGTRKWSVCGAPGGGAAAGTVGLTASAYPPAVGPQTGRVPWDVDEQDEVQGHGAAHVARGQPLPACPVTFSLELPAMASARDRTWHRGS